MKLKPGMTANIVVYTKEVNDAMLISAKAIAYNPDSSLMKDYQIVGRISRKKSGKRAGGGGGGAGGAGGSTAAPKSHAMSSRSDSSGVVKQTAFVWVLQGKKIVQKKIKTGLNDNTQVEVLSGLTADDIVITGATGGKLADSGSGSVGGSPFMPARRGGGGGGGGGGARR
jgi:HlyD family secretion protein